MNGFCGVTMKAMNVSAIILLTLIVSLCVSQESSPELDNSTESINLTTSTTPVKTPFGIYTNVQLYNYLPKLGASWTFISISWGDIEPEQDVWDFEKADRVIQETETYQINLIVKIRTGMCWATVSREVSDPRTSLPPATIEDYSEFVYTLVDKYKDYVDFWAVENEMNTPRFWGGTLEEYNQLIETAYHAIKKADPSAHVLDSGMASMTYGKCIAREMYEKGDVEEAIHFYNEYYKRRGLAVSSEAELKEELYSEASEHVYTVMMDHFTNPYYDVYQLHYYEDYTLLDEVLAFIKTHLQEEKPIFAVEMGYAYRDDTTYDEEDHAECAVKLMVSLLAEGIPVQVYLPLVDLGHGREEWRGLVSPERERRPALTGYRVTAALLKDKELTSKTIDTVFWYNFQDVTVVWSEEETVLDIPLEGKALVCNIAGEREVVSSENSFSLKVGPSPQFIVKSESEHAPEYESGENVEIVEFPSYDGELVEGFLVKPEGDHTFPAVVLVHGGSSSQKAAAQMAQNIGNLFVQRGYVALAVHYRAGPLGLQDVEDTLSGIEYLKTLDFVDSSRIGVYGGSHGGYVALMCAWRSDVKAVAEAAGFCNLGEMVERILQSADEKSRLAEEMTAFYGGYPDEVPDAYQEYSPCGHVSEFTAAVFIIHGKMDTVVPVEHAYQLQELLDYYNKPYEIYLSETGVHGFYHKKTEEASKVWELIFEFFDTHLKS